VTIDPQCKDDGVHTLRTRDSSDPRHFGTMEPGPNCPKNSTLVQKWALAEICTTRVYLKHAGTDGGTALLAVT